ncbi:exodeoxyribonuclease V subunit beta [Rhodococcus sp. SRB_17]|uniref:exodeoxyribonuclease V subunit beta n=1 Tax=Acidovorax sp. SRB_24 TaxID=1962700 RepID=UPI00145F64DE|nr:exodeoxyribonuclease V subunit beta [Acidovorax sp. SRB_24]NMM77152.1 exodeoxyribonuclease V subunit beta [Acidovorax sp. SRB_24]NMM88896.1 exodeoxyribonuclease V subunit beta [Rhodococcus sp. SRB_17]
MSAAATAPQGGDSTALQALDFPLWGSRLIEASAGTGKTWTIASLYLRLVLGHGEGSAFARPLRPAEILVMTFTRAATRELSDRIRARLLEAAQCFRGEAELPASDDFLAALRASYPDGPLRASAAWRLAMAAEGMDDAAIHTIDAWCQRMLREHAFDSGSLFDEELAADERAVQTEAAQDYWRQQCYPLRGDTLDAVLMVWGGVEALVADMRSLAAQALPAGAGEGTLGDAVQRVQRERRSALAALQQGWAERAQAMQQWLDGQTAPKVCDWNRTKLKPANYTKWLEQLAAWARSPEPGLLELTAAAQSRLSPEGLLDSRKDGAPPIALPDHFQAFADLLAALQALPDPAVALRLHAAACVQARMALLKKQSGTFGFADMLQRLDQALAGPNGERLRARMTAQYPVALIDEFQDTSPLQYRIFDRLYRTSANDPGTALLLIGDPKQSIYGFRGADIYSYLAARRATAGRHYVLGTNHRSTEALVRAVNHAFACAEARAGEGAFLFRGSAQADNPLPFLPVQARGRAEQFQSADGPVPALCVQHDLELRSGAQHLRLFAALCAERIATWLNDAQAGFAQAGQPLQRLRPADIAVLVRTGSEAEAVRRELRRRGVASVYLSDKDSVFASDEARDLLHWLQAVAAPLDVRRVRAGLATRTVGLSLPELAQLADDDEAFDARSEQLRALHAVWQTQGVLTMLRQSLHQLGLPARWLAEPGGERRLTNFLHLAELLAEASAQLEGEQALIRWLGQQMQEGAGSGDEQIVRLESDADLVKVVTVHKSKGLEYPVVCLPFACRYRAVTRQRTAFVNLADAQGERALYLQLSEQLLAQADHERQREDLRLLYVALTRARHALWLGFAALKVGQGAQCSTHRSATGYLVGGPGARDAADWLAPLQALAQGPGIALQAAAHTSSHEVPRTRLAPRGAPAALHEQPPYAAEFDRRWGIGSFSQLVRGVGLAATPAFTLDTPRAADDERAFGGADAALDMPRPVVAAGAPPGAAPVWHRFARGAVAGNFLHDQLEWLAGEGFALDTEPALADRLRWRCERAGRGGEADAVVQWLTAVLRTPLAGVGVPLQTLAQTLPEMEFWLPVDRLHAAEVDALCQQHLLAGVARAPLPERALHGMLMGFADLVFEHGGRYWVLDYKSNYLGEGASAYHDGALASAMAAHRYDVQAALYLLALHRLLRERLGAGYEPARQLGGALFLFLRGIDGPAQGVYTVAPSLALLDGLDALLQREEHRA